MPFTPSHAAAALPFVRTPLVPSAVVIGTMGPDLPYFLPFDTFREETHSLLGVVTVDLGIGIAVWLLWVLFLRAPIIDLAPASIRERMSPSPTLPWNGTRRWSRLALLLVAIIIGTLTHLLWDAPTHPGWVSEHVALLRLEVGPKPLTTWLHYASSIVGIIVITVWARGWVLRTPRVVAAGVVTRGIRRRLWVLLAAVFATAGLISWGIGIAGGVHPLDGDLVFAVARVSIGVLLAATGIYCAVWLVYRERSTATTLPRTSA